nr:cell wall-active antibiotics response protein [Lachnospiraceae bacterium]
ENPKKKYINIAGGQGITIVDEKIEDLTTITVVGGTNIDLTKAIITEDADIKCFSFAGGINITVPQNVRVMLDAGGLICAVKNSVPEYEDDDIPTVFITAQTILGGLNVCVRKEED